MRREVITIRATAALSLALLAGGASELRAQHLLIVSDDDRPVSYAYVVLAHGDKFIADETGELTIPGKAHATNATVRRLGFQPWSGRLAGSDSTTHIMLRRSHEAREVGQLDPTDMTLAAVHARAFYARWLQQQQGAVNATFIGPEEIRSRHVNRVTELLYGINGVTIRRLAVPHAPFVAYGTLGGCSMRVLVDGKLRCPSPYFPKEVCTTKDWFAKEGVDVPIDDIVSAQGLQGIEVYAHSGDVPNSLHESDGGFPGCGVIAIWTWTPRSKE